MLSDVDIHIFSFCFGKLLFIEIHKYEFHEGTCAPDPSLGQRKNATKPNGT
jgi:hypothetical protein